MIDPIIVNEPLSTIATEAPAPAAPSDSHPAQVVDDACGGCDSDCSSSSSTLADELVDDDVVTHLKTEADLMNEAMADMKLQYEQHLSKKLDEERSRLHDNYQSAITRKVSSMYIYMNYIVLILLFLYFIILLWIYK